MNSEKITSKRLVLTPICAQDSDYIVKWRNHPAVISNMVIRTPLTKENHELYMQTKIASGEVIQHIISIQESAKKIGTVYFRDIDSENNSAEFGIFIGEDSERGKGYGREATAAFVEYGFSRLHLHRIYLRVFEYNKQAIQCYEQAGFLREGLFRDMVLIDGNYYNMVFMSRLQV